jgi:hypothetical protein
MMTQAMDDATRRINRYLLLQLLVNTGFGLIIGTALYFTHIPNAALWGLSAAVLRFLPYIGPPLSALMPIILSLAVFPGWQHALVTAAIFLGLELIISNIVEPLLYSAHIGLSPLAILVAAVFWTLIWGFPGLVLSTPLTVCLVVMGRYVPSLGFLNVLLGDEPVLTLQAQYYQRLLANDQDEARQVLEQGLKEKSLEEVYSSVVIPALSLAEQDRHRNELDDDTQNFIYQSTRELIEELGDASSEGMAHELKKNSGPVPSQVPSRGSGLDILCIPARDDADDVVAMLLAQLLEHRGHTARSVAIGTTAEMLAKVAEMKPKMVCISALPPFAVGHARALYSNLRSQFAELNIAVCLWQFEGDSQQTALRLKLAPDHGLFATLAQILEHVEIQTGTNARNDALTPETIPASV